MKRNLIFQVTMLAVFFLAVTTHPVKSQVNDPFKNVVAKSTMINGTKLISCDFTKLNQTVDLPLSFFIDGLRMVKLENKDEALVGSNYTFITDNYILVRNKKQNPYKLFDKKGKFITNIGAYGQGPNEYQNVYDDWLDEKNNRVYLLPWQSDKILVYDLKGNALSPIPLKYRVPKGKFKIDPIKKTVSVFQLPFGNKSVIAWTQDFKGNVLGAIPAGHLAINPDFSNEVDADRLPDKFICYRFVFDQNKPDSLYNFNIAKNKLEPIFTLDFNGKPMKIHWYQNTPNYFIGNVTIEKKIAENLSITEVPTFYIVDKRTLKGSYIKINNSYLGGIPETWLGFINGYYVWNADPGDVIDKINKQLKENKKLTEKQRTNLNRMLKTMNKNDNNYIFYGKLKQ